VNQAADPTPSTISDVVRRAVERLISAGIAESHARLDARILAREVLGWDEAAWLTRQHEVSALPFTTAYEVLVERRLRREPADRIRGRREFWGIELEIGPAVLSPRPETELIVEEALELFSMRPPSVVLDAGTGSGCLAIALARALPTTRVVAIDTSAAALSVAAANVARHALGDRIELRLADFAEIGDTAFDLLVSNPPYIPTDDIATLSPEVRDFDPHVALDGGADGLASFRGLFDAARTTLAAGGWLIVEIGINQEPAIRELAMRRPWLEIMRVRPDLQGIPRTVTLRRIGASL